MKTKKSIIAFAILWLVLFTSSTALATLVHGRYLPTAPFSLGSGATVSSYGGNLTEFTKDVECEPWGVIGQIRFTYDTWTGIDPPPDPQQAIGGAALVGGFYGDCPVKMRPGYEWGWIQTVTSTFSGKNAWGAPNGTTFPDTLDTKDPDYPNTNPGITPAPTIGFEDFPWRYFDAGDQYWFGELGLVCKNKTEKKVCILDTFQWGFQLVQDPQQVTPWPPELWGNPSTGYMNSLRSHFDGVKGTKWEFVDACCCCIPEPATVGLLALGGLVLLRRRKR